MCVTDVCARGEIRLFLILRSAFHLSLVLLLYLLWRQHASLPNITAILILVRCRHAGMSDVTAMPFKVRVPARIGTLKIFVEKVKDYFFLKT